MTEDFDVDDEIGFEPAVSATGADRRPAAREARPSSGRRRAPAAAAGALAALTVLAARADRRRARAYAAFAGILRRRRTPRRAPRTSPPAGSCSRPAASPATARTCRACPAAARPCSASAVPRSYFQVEHRPHAGRRAGCRRAAQGVKFNEVQIQQLGAYVQSVGGGPRSPTGSLRDPNIAAGGSLFRLNCASCHGTTGERRAAVGRQGRARACGTPRTEQIYAAMITGPESMPIFSDNQITPRAEAADHRLRPDAEGVRGPGRRGHRPHRSGVRGAW